MLTGRVASVIKTFAARAAREGRWWVVSVDGIGVTQSRTLRDAPAQARGLIAAILDADEDGFSVVVEPVLDPALTAQVRAARRLVADLERFQQEAAAASRTAAHALVAAGVSGADAATVLDVSPQRVSQLLARTKPTRAASTVPAEGSPDVHDR